jgi:hypothetical protein
MKRWFWIPLVWLVAGATWAGLQTPLLVRQAAAPALTAFPWGTTPLDEVVVANLTTNEDRMQYICLAANRQRRLVGYYETGIITQDDYEFVATAQTITAIKQEFAALRTRVRECETLVTAE